MFLHIGNEKIISTKDIVGVFDIEKTSVSKHTKDFLNKAGKQKRVNYVSMDMPKSFVVCLDEDLNETVYISPISAATLIKRISILNELKT